MNRTSKMKPRKMGRKFLNNLETGDIVMTRENSLLSLVIRLLHGPFPYSHACIVGEKIKGEPTIYTAAYKSDGHKGAGYYSQVNARNYLRNRSFVVCRIKGGMSRNQKTRIIDWCKYQKGEKYPTKKVLKFIADGFKGVGVSKVFLKGLEDKEHCFEGVAAAYGNAGIVLNKRAQNTDYSGYDGKELYLSPRLVDIHSYN